MNLPPATQRLALLLPLGLTMASGIAGPGHAADSACLYQSRSYSEGAYICVQRSLMQTCASDGSRMTWRIVADRDLSERCTAPLTYAEPRRRIVHRAAGGRPR